MIKYTDAITGKSGFVMVARIVSVKECKPGSRAKSLIALDTGDFVEVYEDVQTIYNRVQEYQVTHMFSVR